MFDDLDDGARVGVWTTLALIALLLFGLIGGLALRQMKPAAAVAEAPVSATPAGDDAVLDIPLAGDLTGTVYFMVGMLNSAPLRIPVGQRAVMVFKRV